MTVFEIVFGSILSTCGIKGVPFKDWTSEQHQCWVTVAGCTQARLESLEIPWRLLDPEKDYAKIVGITDQCWRSAYAK
jgi:hypothetical protein